MDNETPTIPSDTRRVDIKYVSNVVHIFICIEITTVG